MFRFMNKKKQKNIIGKIHKAAARGNLSQLKKLGKKHGFNMLDEHNRTPLHLACVSGQEEVVAFLAERKAELDLCDDQHSTALMKAVQCGQQGCVAALLKHGADPNVMDVDGNTALHFAALVPSVALAAQLVRHGADIEARNKEGCTPLLLATAENHIRVVTLLHKKGAKINARDNSMRTPLMIAASNGFLPLVCILLSYGADASLEDSSGHTAEVLAAMHGHHGCSNRIMTHGTKSRPAQTPSHSKGQEAKLPGSLSRAWTLGGAALDSASDPSIEDAQAWDEVASLKLQLTVLQNKCHRVTHSLAEKTALLESAQRERDQAQAHLQALLREVMEPRHETSVPEESLAERLARAQLENQLLRQQLAAAQKQGLVHEKALAEEQERFRDSLAKMKADCDNYVQNVEDCNQALLSKNRKLRALLAKQQSKESEREVPCKTLPRRKAWAEEEGLSSEGKATDHSEVKSPVKMMQTEKKKTNYTDQQTSAASRTQGGGGSVQQTKPCATQTARLPREQAAIGVVRGSCHQGHERFGHNSGKQCVPNSFCSVIYSEVKSPEKWDSADLDAILQRGNKLYSKLQSTAAVKNTYTLVTELPGQLKVFGTSCTTSMGESVAGLLGGPSDSALSGIVLSLGDALQTTLTEFRACLVTFAGSTFAVIRGSRAFHVFDSHSRNENGMQIPDGTCVLITKNSIQEVTQHCVKLAESLNANKLSQFEITGLNVHVI
ncbi:putative ankyrin repeat domain-containing protein 20A4 isoform X1 [Amia ocellicauda]|uniref:putative ankyrin repeat domain-containing protein 20A4 isoform X1 n=1 Tax=Amia ocellicauda TaxID=2972642 RepID=UPI0034639923